MQSGDAVLLIRQPWNAHDAHAVGVHNLRGDLLGYIPREINKSFQVASENIIS